LFVLKAKYRIQNKNKHLCRGCYEGEFKADRVIILFPTFHNRSNFTLWILPHLFKNKTAKQ